VSVRLAAALLVLCACGPPYTEGGPEGHLETFIAFPKDFSGYRHWESFTVQSAPLEGEVHASGDRTMYLSRKPEHGSTEFPVGTLIVKTLPGAGRVFAQVKRGGGFNAAGAAGWEWFELQHTTLDDVSIVWRGVGPPTGEGYGGDPNGCNSCHMLSKTNDCVASEDLQLQRF
jgi:hypothetical protein